MKNATYDYSKFEDCVARGMFLAEKAMAATGQQAVGCKWAIEQAIINRNSGETMMTAVIRYTDGLEYRLEQAAECSMTASQQCKQARLKSLAELAPETGKLIELMEWLASPDFGALNMGQAGHIARSIARGNVPHVKMENVNG